MFYRRQTDGTRVAIPLENQFAGPTTSPCWLIGGGPSLTGLAVEQIECSAAPRFAMNLAGSGLIRPQFWTSYDPTSRFHRSIYLDAGITKFVHEARGMDLVPETTFKVCDSPSLYLIDRTSQRGFHDFPGTETSPMTDWQDSLIQAIEIAYRLGFRELYLAGCEMWIAPSPQLRRAAARVGVKYSSRDLLGNFVQNCEAAGLPRERIEELATGPQYHFEEAKSLAAAIQTDAHYFRIAQTLRLCRRSMGLKGLQLVSVTPGSRLNDYFPTMPVSRACQRIAQLAGDPRAERTLGRYSIALDRRARTTGPMRDVKPHFWSTATPPQQHAPADPVSPPVEREDRFNKLHQAIEELPDIAIDLDARD